MKLERSKHAKFLIEQFRHLQFKLVDTGCLIYFLILHDFIQKTGSIRLCCHQVIKEYLGLNLNPQLVVRVVSQFESNLL